MLQDNILSLHIPSQDPYYPIIQYADVTIVVVPDNEMQLLALKEMLISFHSSTGLKVNFNKSSMIPLNVSDEEATSLVAIFGCSIGQMPFTYLGLPMGTTKPKI